MSLISIKNLSAGYGVKQVLSDVSLALQESEIGLIVGPNGSGKSTLIKSIFGFTHIFSVSELTYQNARLFGKKPQELNDLGLVYVPQYNNVFEKLTVKENFQLCIHARIGKSSQEVFKRTLETFSDLTSMLEKSVALLSGGQKKLLAIAIGLINTPKLVLLDEPLAGLDEKTTRKIISIIEFYRKHHSIAFLIAEHRFNKFAEIADRYIGLRLGKTLVTLENIDTRSLTFENAMQKLYFE